MLLRPKRVQLDWQAETPYAFLDCGGHMIDTIIFDFDGTVMDTNKVIIASWQHTYNTLTGGDGDLEYILEPLGNRWNTA